MATLTRVLRFLSAPAFVVLVAAVVFVMNNRTIHERCVDTRDARKQGNVRAEVLRNFLSIAEEARAMAAKTADTPVERQFNQKAADDYRHLRDRVKDVPLPRC